jgi:hypothetical protein
MQRAIIKNFEFHGRIEEAGVFIHHVNFGKKLKHLLKRIFGFSSNILKLKW